ncbi:MAG TPA: PqqD family protein [Candidatus Latescibacteria bacterium]|nr:PqqD family protein [Candidatus Latescibacterota bacterium]HOS65781.1 PqqD family protein [Candidatus Latescibacterota bacterium]HPK74682.1 PqqD family protein [Candidatus Latescibacterota bacterium]HQK22801.1 PqqD family protein [Candidatus Latescibacterota bacterium]
MFGKLFKKREAPRLTKDDLLSSRPVLNQAISWSLNNQQEVQITIPRREVWWAALLSKIIYTPKERVIALDEVGTAVWKMIERRLTVREMIAELSARYNLNRREAEASLIEYLRRLAKKNFVGFEVPRQRRKTKR